MSHFSNAYRTGMDSVQLLYKDSISESSTEDITVLMIFDKVQMAPLFGGLGYSLDMKKWPPDMLLEFVSDS